MAGLVRPDALGKLRHIVIRGMERRRIFIDDRDKDSLTDRLAMRWPDTGTFCHAGTLI